MLKGSGTLKSVRSSLLVLFNRVRYKRKDAKTYNKRNSQMMTHL
jgi:hypothetical protein